MAYAVGGSHGRPSADPCTPCHSDNDPARPFPSIDFRTTADKQRRATGAGGNAVVDNFRWLWRIISPAVSV